MFGFGPKELIVVAVVVILLFGAKKIPELARGIAEGIRELRGAVSDKGEDKTS